MYHLTTWIMTHQDKKEIEKLVCHCSMEHEDDAFKMVRVTLLEDKSFKSK